MAESANIKTPAEHTPTGKQIVFSAVKTAGVGAVLAGLVGADITLNCLGYKHLLAVMGVGALAGGVLGVMMEKYPANNKAPKPVSDNEWDDGNMATNWAERMKNAATQTVASSYRLK
jgi:hypothetical protein